MSMPTGSISSRFTIGSLPYSITLQVVFCYKVTGVLLNNTL